MNQILIVIPTYNERDNVTNLIKDIFYTIDNVHILVVDDNSPDGTAGQVLDYKNRSRAKIDVLIRKAKRGLGGAYKAGFEYGLERDYDIIVTMDADLSHDPKYLIAMLNKVPDYDLVIGSRYIMDGGVRNWPLKRIFLSRCANMVTRAMLGVSGNDMTSGYRAYKSNLLRQIDISTIRSNGYSFLVEMYYRAYQKKARIYDVPIIFSDRRQGKSKISQKEIFLAIFTLLRLRIHSISKKL